MIEIVGLILSIIFYIVFAIYFVNKQDSKQKKYIFILLFCILFIPSFFLSLDNINFFSNLGWFKNSSSERWFSFFSNYISTLLGSAVSGSILIYITLFQINKTKSLNTANEKEQNRINNLPFIKYNFEVFEDYNVTAFYEPDFITNNDNNKIIFLKIRLKNIGMNTVKKCNVNISSILISDNYYYKIDEQELIEKNGEKDVVFKILVNNTEDKIELIVQYQDILLNFYEQKVLLKISEIEFNKDDLHFMGSIIKEVYEEIVIVAMNPNVRGE